MSIFGKLKSKKAGEKKEPKEVSSTVQSASRKVGGHLASLIKQSWITERAGDLTKDRKYIFIVKESATKPEIKKAIEAIYNVDVIRVNVINTKGKTKRLGRSMGRTSKARKAVITLKQGQKIDVIPT